MLTKNKLSTFKKCSGLWGVTIHKFSACGLFALWNPLMRALQFVYFRACAGLFRCKIPYDFENVRDCDGLFAVQNPRMRVQFGNFRACASYLRWKTPLWDWTFSRMRRAICGAKSPYESTIWIFRACGSYFRWKIHLWELYIWKNFAPAAGCLWCNIIRQK